VNEQRHIEQSLRSAGRDLSLHSVFSRALSAQGWASFWWLLGITAWCGWLTALVPGIQKPFKDALAQSPNLAKLFSGGDVGTNAGFLSVLVFSFAIAIVVSFALALALTWASDLENGRLELLLSTPRSRTRMLLERTGAIGLMLLLAVVLSWLAVIVGAQKVNLSIDVGKILLASIGMLPPMLIVVTLAFALAGRLRYGSVIGLLAGYIALAFLGDLLKGLLNLPDWLLKLSIFHLYGTPVLSGMDWGAFLGMLGVAILLLLLGILQFRYGDIERG
jgi:ABC-2 type transport system permease protein